MVGSTRLPASGRHYRPAVSQGKRGYLFLPLQMQLVFRAVAEALG
ncbi:hypothetical protein ACUDTI_19310 [Stenotrophomonas pavanii]|uniref:Uncharacterized protein n=1 Tax=Stenotrophomonas pavanii TaxID=487698 RepID=A0ABM7R6B3_9GAMM|nr:hypothetical protein [Stenotrophomonas pavanii]BCX45427.1 hypothetical protein STNY_R36470 [Stenotrophomonas pavanii]